MLTLAKGCKAFTEQQVIQKSFRAISTFDMETETLQQDIELLLGFNKIGSQKLSDLRSDECG